MNEKPFEDMKHCMSSLTKGVVKFAQVVGVFPGPRFDDADADAGEADVELLGWEESPYIAILSLTKCCVIIKKQFTKANLNMNTLWRRVRRPSPSAWTRPGASAAPSASATSWT